MTVALYGANLFGRAYKSAVIKGMNNAPGGAGGVDDDVQHNLGAPGSATKKDRKHGICCGITIAWIVGACHQREDAINTTGFDAYFRDVLRFQGAYMKDNKGNVGSIDDLNGIHPHGLGRSGNGKATIDELSGRLPTSGTWATYLGIWHHAIGVGMHGKLFGGTYYIMDPNAGLFKYNSRSAFITDLKQLCEARRLRKGEAADAKISFTNFKKT